MGHESRNASEITARDIYAQNVVSGTQNINIAEEQSYNVSGLPNPYLGLRAFTYDDRDLYAGRSYAVDEAVTKLTQPGDKRVLLFVTGASGSGKSSFAQAGLLPALATHYEKRNVKLLRSVFRPSRRPLPLLQDALEQVGIPSRDALGDRQLADVALIIIDQFEELFTQSDRGQRDAVIAWLEALPSFEQARVHLIATLRSDFLNELFQYKGLWEIAKQGMELRAMSVAELGQAIQRPLQARFPTGEKRLQPELVVKLSADAAGDASLLPLLQVTLEDLWHKGRLTLASYHTLTDAIRQRAESVYAFEDYDNPSPIRSRSDDHRAAIIQTFLDLVNVSLDDDYRRDVRISRAKADLGQSREALVDDLVRSRLLSTSIESDVETVRIIHETLISNWERLRNAVRDARQQLQQRVRFEQQVKDWQASDKSDDYLLTGVQLAQARDLERVGSVALQVPDAREFLRRSVDGAEAEQRRELEEQRRRADEQASFARRLRNIAVALAIAVFIALGATGIAVVSRNDARISESAAVDARNTAQAESTRAVEQEQIAVVAQGTAEARRSEAEAERDRAEKERALALARQLAAQAVIAVDRGLDAELSLLLAVEAKSTLYSGGETTNVQVDEALRRSIDSAPVSVIRLSGADPITTEMGELESPVAVAFSPSGEYVMVTIQCGGDCLPHRVIDVRSGIEIAASENKVVAISPDGQTLAAINAVGAVQVVEIETEKVLAVVESDHELASEAVHVGPTGTQLAVISKAGQVVLLDLATSPSAQRILLPQHPARSMAYSADGTGLVVIDESGEITVWNAVTGRQVAAFRDAVKYGLATFSPDGKWLVASGSSSAQAGVIRLWDANTGQTVMEWANSGQIQCLTFSHQLAKLLAMLADGHVYVWDINPPKLLGEFVGGLLNCTGIRMENEPFSSDGQLLFTGGGYGAPDGPNIWNISTGSLIASFGPYAGYLTHVRFGGRSDRAALIVASDAMRPSTLHIVDTKSGRELAAHQHLGAIYDAEMSPDGAYIVTVSSRDYDLVKPGPAYIWSLDTAQLVRTIRHTSNGSIADVAFDESGRHFATLGTDNTLRIWDASFQATQTLTYPQTYDPQSTPAVQNGISPISVTVDGTHVRLNEPTTGHLIHDLRHDGDVTSYVVNSDYTRLAASLGGSTAYLWDITLGELLAVLPDGEGLGFSADGRRLMAAAFAGPGVVIWDAMRGRVVATIQPEDGMLMEASLSPDGTRLITLAGIGFARRQVRSVTFWDVDRQRELNRIDGVTVAKFSPAGHQWVAGNMDGAVKILNSGTGAETAVLTHDAEVVALDLSSRNGLLAVAGRDGSVRVWNLGRLEPVAILQHAHEIASIAFNDDGKLLTARDVDNNTQVWLVDLDGLSTLACVIVTRNLSLAEWHEYVGSGQPYRATCPEKKTPA